MVERKIIIRFTRNEPIHDHMDDITEAVIFAAKGLKNTHGIMLTYPVEYDYWHVLVKMYIPDDMEVYEVGRHLKGISRYLTKNYGYTYKPLRLGTRLFEYGEIA